MNTSIDKSYYSHQREQVPPIIKRVRQPSASYLRGFTALLAILVIFFLSNCTSSIQSADGVYEIVWTKEPPIPKIRVEGLLLSDGYFIPSAHSEEEMQKINQEYGIHSLSIRGFATPEYFDFRTTYSPSTRCFVFSNLRPELMSAIEDEVIAVFVSMDIALYPPLSNQWGILDSDPSIPYFPAWMERGAAWICTRIHTLSSCPDASISRVNAQYRTELNKAYQSKRISYEQYCKILSQMDKPFDENENDIILYSDIRFPYEYAQVLQSKGNVQAMQFMEKLIKKYPDSRERIENKNQTNYARF